MRIFMVKGIEWIIQQPTSLHKAVFILGTLVYQMSLAF